MKRNKLKHAAYILLFLFACSPLHVLAQVPVRTGPAPEAEIKKARAGVDAYPDSLGAHKTYIYALGLNNPQLEPQYKVWMEKYPANAIFPLAIGTVFYNAEMPQATPYLLKVAAMEPKNAKIWFMLSQDAWRRGETHLVKVYMKKAAMADTSNADYAAGYLASFKDIDPGYAQKVFDFVKRFPNSERGAQALFWLGEDAASLNDKIIYFEKLRNLYPPKNFNWSAAGMAGLADAYIQTEPEKAMELVDEMGEGKNWQIRKQVAGSVLRIDQLEKDKNYTDALLDLNRIKLPAYNHLSDYIALKKTDLMAKAGDIKAAYDSVAVKFAKLPTDQLDTALLFYGTKIGKDAATVAKDIQNIRKSTAAVAYPFELGLYTSDGKLSLNDLKGKVVLLTFWFPGCGPCREEFPHFQAVINKFKDENVAYIGINVFPLQDGYVIPLLKNNKYSFIPLRGTSAFAAEYYGVQGEPENFLIDKDGKIIFKDFRIDNSNERTLELMITALLQKGGQSN